MNIDTKKDTYTIGTVAALLGISPDSLRHYEKRGLIHSKKQENGYRYYTNEDLRDLLSVLYYRKMDISLCNMPILLKHTSTSYEVATLIDEKIHAEEAAIWKHQQNITRLNMMKLQNQRTEEYQKDFSIHSFPGAYIIDNCSSSQEVICRWFQRSNEVPGLDMAYFYDEFALSDTDQTINYIRSQLLLYDEVSAAIPASFWLAQYPRTTPVDCVCFSFTTNAQKKPSVQINQMADWARSRGHDIQGSCFVTTLNSGYQDADRTCDMELYLPLREHKVRSTP